MKKFIYTFFFFSTFVLSANVDIRMVNAGADGQVMVFDPPFVKISKGDSVTFLPTDMLHNSESIPSLSPVSGTSWKGEMNEKITVTFDQEGVYIYQCTPHIALGMIGVLQVGAGTNLADIRKSVSSLESKIFVNKERIGQYLSMVN